EVVAPRDGPGFERAARPRRSHPPPAGPVEPPHERAEVHRSGRRPANSAGFGRGPGAIPGERQREGDSSRVSLADLRALHAGRQLDDAGPRWVGARPRDLAEPGGDDGWTDRGGEPRP